MTRRDAYRITSELVNPEPSHDQRTTGSPVQSLRGPLQGFESLVGPVVFADPARCGNQPQGPRGDERVNTTKLGPLRDLAARSSTACARSDEETIDRLAG
jgi:hypothetical protein